MAKQGAYQFPLRQWIRENFTKVRGEIFVECIHCLKLLDIFQRGSHFYGHLIYKHSDKLTEEQKKDEHTHWTFDHFTLIHPTDTHATCNICRHIMQYNPRRYSDWIRHLKRHEITCPRTDDIDNANNYASTSQVPATEQELYQFPLRQWIRRNFTKVRGQHYMKCNHCSQLDNKIELGFLRRGRMSYFYGHLVCKHSDKLTEEQKKDKHTHWTFDHFTLVIHATDTYAKCNKCQKKMQYNPQRFNRYSVLIKHLKLRHGITCPRIDDTDNESNYASRDVTIEKDEVHSAASTSIYNTLYENTEDTDVLNQSPSKQETLNQNFDFLPSTSKTTDVLYLPKDVDLILNYTLPKDTAEHQPFSNQSSSAAFFPSDVAFFLDLAN